MAFYTANWVKKLIKEDHANLKKHIEKKDNDFRSYIDSTLPFTLYLSIDNIRKNVLNANSKFILELGKLLDYEGSEINYPQLVLEELENAYKKTINYYINTYPHIAPEDLSKKLQSLSASVNENTGNIKNTLKQEFGKTYIVKTSGLSKLNDNVLIISPKFTTIQSKFGSVVKSNFDLSKFSDYKPYSKDGTTELLASSPRTIIQNFLKENFGMLNNLGHIEVDIISSTGKEVKRGLVSPRLIQALFDWPKDSRPDLLARRFSKETGQATTRIKVRKKFSDSKLVLEMLIEAGMMIGSVESQEENLRKAPKERAFLIGRNLTERLRKNPELISNLETSKSITQFLVDSVISTIKDGIVKDYVSNTTLDIKTPISRQKVEIGTPIRTKSKTSLVKQPRVSTTKEITPLVSLQAIINSRLHDQIKQNMGTGNSRSILNYRTGRLAHSAQVERMSQSREGMITAFYSYMKNPYATFSAGGRQEYPRSRDPKALISKSIREIAAEMAYTRMRAVLV